MTTTLHASLRHAILNGDAWRCGRIAETLRFRFGWDYDRTFKFAHAICGVDLPEWDALLYEAGELEEPTP